MEIVSGKIVGIDQSGMTIHVPYTNWERFATRKYEDVEVGLADGRTITPQQRRKAYALMGEIVEYTGEELEEVKAQRKHEYLHKHATELESEMFSLSDCSVTQARGFISYLIEFMIRNDIPSRYPLTDLNDDIQHYVYTCLKYRKCCICGMPSDLHHWDRIGMGRDRRTIIHEGMQMMPLCRAHHTECHTMVQTEFDKRYHIEPVTCTKEICKVYGLKAQAD